MTVTEQLRSAVLETGRFLARRLVESGECLGCGAASRTGRRRVAGPRFSICERCVQRGSAALEGWHPEEVIPMAVAATARRCDFCGKGRAHCFGLVAWPRGAICGECITLAETLFDDDPLAE